MKSTYYRFTPGSEGYSLVEVMLAMALIASAMVTLMALIPVGLKSSRDATNSIIMGHIVEDAHERLEGKSLIPGQVDGTPFYYDDEGVFIADSEDRKNLPEETKLRLLYKVDINLIVPGDKKLQETVPDLKAVMMEVTWPVDPQTGDIIGAITRNNRKSVTYFVNTLSAPRWKEQNYTEKIEY